MNKYEEAFNVIETILHLMCGEEREDGYKPSHDEMVNSMEDFKELVKKETPNKILEVSKEEYELSGYKHCCPICGQLVGTITKDGNIEPDDYCCSCGQKLDWSVEDDYKVFAINGRTFYEVKDENGKLLRGQEIFDYIERLEKALDKACEELEKWDINNFDNTTVTKEKWKEELMKDEED